MMTSTSRDYKFEPELLGPLQDRPLAETASSGGPDDLFPGASTFLSARHQRRRREQWNIVRPLAQKLLRPDEHLLYVAHAMQVPPALHSFALGAMALSYHQVMLVFTESRLIEILLTVRGKTAGTRIRSYPWQAVRDVKVSFAKLRLAPIQGKKQDWRIPLRGDRKLLKLLMARLSQRRLAAGASASPQALPLWHCPSCAAPLAEKALRCQSCSTAFRSPRLAMLLSLAFPGAGLLYAGHPFLALMDCLGEIVFFFLFLMMMLQSEPGAVASAVFFGAFLFFITKLESIHVSHILVARTKPETPQTQSRYARLAVAGGIASFLLIGSAFPLAGAARPRLDRDLDVVGGGSQWEGTRNVAQWDAFQSNANARSQWQHPSGVRVTLLAYAQSPFDSASDFRSDFRQEWKKQDISLVLDDEDVPAPFKGFRFVGLTHAEDGRPVSLIQYFIVDETNHDIHQATAAVLGEDAVAVDSAVRDLLEHAHWVDPMPPERTAKVAGG